MSKVRCEFPDGTAFYAKREEADAFVQDGAAVRDGNSLRMTNQDRTRRGLSCKVGAELAEAVRKRKGWAVVALSEIER